VNKILRALEEIQFVSNKLDPATFAVAILVSLVASLVAALLYRFFYEHRGTGSQVHRAFPLLGISITALFIGVQTSLPLSLGLLGALSIIRFRTPIKEPEEVGFIMLVIAGSIMCSTFNFAFLAILHAIAIASLFAARGARLWKYSKRDGLLMLTMPDKAAAAMMPQIKEYLQTNTKQHVLESSASHDDKTSVQYSFTSLTKEAVDLQSGLKAFGDLSTVNVFFDRPGGIK